MSPGAFLTGGCIALLTDERFKLLIDTNVVIGLEDAQPVQAPLAELVQG
jgi:hypothetical protein